MSSSSAKAAFTVLPAAMVCLLALPSFAESDRAGSAGQFFVQEREKRDDAALPPRHIRPAAPRFGSVPSRRAVTASAPASARPSAPPERRLVRRIAPVAPAASTGVPVTVYGDRLAQALAIGLQEDAGGKLAVTALTGEQLGLTQADYDDRLQSLASRLRKDRAAVAVVMIGSNDRQALPDGATLVDPATPRWSELYGARVDAFAAVFRDAHVPLVWVGLPNVHGDEASASFVKLNGIFRDRAARNGVTFVDSWEAFSDDTGLYSPMGPDVEGQTVKLRKADGIGFTRAGGRKLASFVEADIKRLEADPAPPQALPSDIAIEKARDFDQALDIDVNAQIQREAGLLPDTAADAAKAPPGKARPAAGPVLALTAPPQSPGGQLATATIPTSAGLASTLSEGGPDSSPPSSRQPGRADDFSWPRH